MPVKQMGEMTLEQKWSAWVHYMTIQLWCKHALFIWHDPSPIYRKNVGGGEFKIVDQPKPTRIERLYGDQEVTIMSFEEFCNGGKTRAGRTIEEHYKIFCK